MKYSMLVVDDEKDIVDSLERQFRKTYNVFKATSGPEALKILQSETVQLIISDQRMPDMTGVQLFSRALLIQPEAVRILLTGYTDIASVISAINTGQIYKYVTKPWDPGELDQEVSKAFEIYDLKNELKGKNRKLEAALDELKSLDEAKNNFMILIGHELKTPLTSIKSFLGLVKEEVLSSDVKKYVQRIEEGTDRLHNIVFDVLDIIGAQVGQSRLNKAAHRLSGSFQKADTHFDQLLQSKNLTLEYPIEKTVCTYDETVVDKVLKKIIHNAIKFSTPNSKIEITVAPQNSHVEVSVTNVGKEMSPEKIQKVLKPFSLDENIMHHTQGIGLGLAVCQSLLKRHGSELTITSKGPMSTVSFTLPLA